MLPLVLNIHRVVYLHRYLVVRLHGWCHVKMLPSGRTFCVYHTTMPPFKVSLYSMPPKPGACVFSCDLPPALLTDRLGSLLGSFTCYCGNTGVGRIPK